MNEGKRICSRRILSSFIWTVIFELLLACTCLIMVHFSVWNPISWILDAISILISPKTWLSFIPVIISTAAFVIMYGAEFGSVAPYIPNRIGYIQRTFTIRNGLLALSLIMLSTFSTWFYVSAFNGNYTSISTTCTNSDDKCLIEEKLYLIMGSVFVGLYIYVTDFAFHVNCLRYPVVQQLKLIQIREDFFNLLKECFARSLWPVTVFTVSYPIIGGAIRDYLTDVLSIKTVPETSFSFRDLILVFYLCMLTFVYIFTVRAARYLLNLHLTERHVFPVVINDGSCEKVKLSDAMAMQQLPVVHNLAYLDLKLLAEKDFARRQQLYILSQPGGHPYNWNGVISECMKLINSYVECINLACSETLGEKYVGGNAAQRSEPPQSTFLKSTNTSMRNLSLTAVTDSFMQDALPPAADNISFTDVLKSYWHQIVEYIYKSAIVSYFFGIIPDSRLHWTLSQAQPVIWATQGIAFITTASFKEDDYGISLKDLPAIVISLVKLNKTMMKLPKFIAQKQTHCTEVRSTKMRHALRCALECSLYKIIITYGIYLRDLRLPSEIFQELQNFRLQLES